MVVNNNPSHQLNIFLYISFLSSISYVVRCVSSSLFEAKSCNVQHASDINNIIKLSTKNMVLLYPIIFPVIARRNIMNDKPVVAVYAVL